MSSPDHYRIEITGAALRVIGHLARPQRERIRRAIDALGENPRPAGVKKLSGRSDEYRIRVGDYRVVYTIRDDILLVLVVRVAHRREVYRG
jgi:mRNA interferase RelE/StbE